MRVATTIPREAVTGEVSRQARRRFDRLLDDPGDRAAAGALPLLVAGAPQSDEQGPGAVTTARPVVCKEVL